MESSKSIALPRLSQDLNSLRGMSMEYVVANLGSLNPTFSLFDQELFRPRTFEEFSVTDMGDFGRT